MGMIEKVKSQIKQSGRYYPDKVTLQWIQTADSIYYDLAGMLGTDVNINKKINESIERLYHTSLKVWNIQSSYWRVLENSFNLPWEIRDHVENDETLEFLENSLRVMRSTMKLIRTDNFTVEDLTPKYALLYWIHKYIHKIEPMKSRERLDNYINMILDKYLALDVDQLTYDIFDFVPNFDYEAYEVALVEFSNGDLPGEDEIKRRIHRLLEVTELPLIVGIDQGRDITLAHELYEIFSSKIANIKDYEF